MTASGTAFITGRGVICALGPDVASFAAAVREGRAATLSPAPGSTEPDIAQCYAIAQGVLPDGKRDEPASTLAIATASLALTEAGIEAGAAPLDDVGLVMSNVLGPSAAIESYIEALALKGPRPMKPTHFIDTILSMPGSRVGIALKLRGSTAVLGGSSPFELALSWIRQGREHTIVAGGAEPLSPKCIRHHRELARRSGADRLGLGQGAAFVVLEAPEHARARNATIYGELLGAGAASEPQDSSVTWSGDPSGRAFELSMREAIADAEVAPEDVGLIVLAAGDAPTRQAETAATKRIFGAHATTLTYSCVKPLFGEALGASAGLGLIAALTTLESTGGLAIANSFEMGGSVTSLVVRASR